MTASVAGASATSSRRREPVLDGLRGVAILLVLFYHFVIYSGIPRAGSLDRYVVLLGSTGWVGVDVFFVLSGFLITGILLDTKSDPGFFRTFYARRTLRIFPLYYGVLALFFLVGPLVFGQSTSDGGEVGPIWFWTYMSNVHIAVSGWTEPLAIGHFWSLAVEEQFYLVWPLVVFALSRKGLFRVVVACFFAAFALRLLAPSWLRPVSTYVLMPMRMDALAVGAFGALVVRGPRGWAALGRWPGIVFVGSSIGLAAIFVWRRGFLYADPVVRTLGFSLVAVCSGAFMAIVLASPEGSRLRRALSSRMLITFGTYSYGLYVLHHIVVIALRERGFQTDLFPVVMGSHVGGLVAFSVVAMAASWLLAYLSWHALEMPFLRLKRRFEYRRPAAAVPASAPPVSYEGGGGDGLGRIVVADRSSRD